MMLRAGPFCGISGLSVAVARFLALAQRGALVAQTRLFVEPAQSGDAPQESAGDPAESGTTSNRELTGVKTPHKCESGCGRGTTKAKRGFHVYTSKTRIPSAVF